MNIPALEGYLVLFLVIALLVIFVARKKKKLYDALLAGHTIAVGDAKAWDRLLDVSLKRVGGDLFRSFGT